MRLKNLLVLLLVITVSFISCSKDDKTEEVPTFLGSWEYYASKTVTTIKGEAPVVALDTVFTKNLTVITFKADGTGITKSYDDEAKEWEETGFTYVAKDGKFKMVEDGSEEDEPGDHNDGTYELSKNELILKQVIVDEYQGKEMVFNHTEKLRRIK